MGESGPTCACTRRVSWGDVDAPIALYPLISFPFAFFDFLYHEFVVTGPLNPEQRCSSVQRLLRIRSCDNSEMLGLVAQNVNSPTWHRGNFFQASRPTQLSGIPPVPVRPRDQHACMRPSRSADMHVLALW